MLNNKEKKVFDFIKKKLGEGISPSVREIMDEMGFKSTSTAHRYIASLVKEGVIEKTGNKNRSLRLPVSQAKYISIIGDVKDGELDTAFEEIQGYVSFEADNYSDSELFALRIKGKEMINAGILEGDITVIARNTPVENGDIVAVFLEESVTLKRFYREDGHYRLQSENDSVKPVILDECEILGKVIGLKRYY